MSPCPITDEDDPPVPLDPDAGDGEEEVDEGEDEEPLPPPEEEPHEPGPRPNPGGEPDPPQGDWYPVYIGSINIKHGLGGARARNDIRKITSTKAEVIGFTEMPGRKVRKPIMDAIPGWGVAYPEAGGEAIMWRQSVFSLIASGIFHGTPNPSPGNPRRHTNWVKLRHKPSGRIVFLFNTHISAWIETRGRPRRPNKKGDADIRLPGAYYHIEKLKDEMRQAAATGAAVFSVGDFNIDYFWDKRVRYPKFLYAKMRSIGAVCSFDAHRPPTATWGKNRWIDHCWAVRPKDRGIRFVQNWVLTDRQSRYYTDHKPLVTKAMLRRKR